MRRIIIYEIKSASVPNSKVLVSENQAYFYWNHLRFQNYKADDIVFVVNRKLKWAFCCSIDKLNIPSQYDKEKRISFFSDLAATYEVSDENRVYTQFVRFKILSIKEIPPAWNWQSQLGQAETYILVKEGEAGNRNRLPKVNDLKKIFSDGEGLEFLNEAEQFLSNGTITSRVRITEAKKENSQTDMNILTAIKTKPFILLAGISGTGKSRLVRTLAYRTCPEGELRSDDNKPGNFELIAVRPNWHDSTELLGYVSRISNPATYIITPFIRFLVKAWHYTDVPFFLCLDEMNLAPVEQYFAEYLSIIETRQWNGTHVQTDFLLSKASFQDDSLYGNFLIQLGAANNSLFTDGIRIPPNLIVMGTVNMDETTHSFSRKVLDRAMTIEMNQVNLDEGLNPEKEDWKYPLPADIVSADKVIGNFTAGAQVAGKFNEKEAVLSYLKKLNEILEGTPFKIAYRVRDEFLIYCYYALSSDMNEALLNAALDEMTCKKILSRIEGDENKTRDVLLNMEKVFSGKFPASHSKVKEMLARLDGSGYTSFWA